MGALGAVLAMSPTLGPRPGGEKPENAAPAAASECAAGSHGASKQHDFAGFAAVDLDILVGHRRVGGVLGDRLADASRVLADVVGLASSRSAAGWSSRRRGGCGSAARTTAGGSPGSRGCRPR